MKCPICQNELEIKNKKVGENEAGEAIFNEYGICRTCKKQWNLDKHRAKKAEQPKIEEPVKEVAPVVEEPVKETVAKPKKKKRPVNPDAINATSEEQPRPKKKKRPAPVIADVPETNVAEDSIEKALEAFSEIPVSETPVDRPKKKKRPVVDDATKVLDKLPSLEEFTSISEEVPPVEQEVVEKPKKKKRPAPAKEDVNELSLDDALETLSKEPTFETPVSEEPVERPRKKKRPVNPDAVNVTSEEQPRPRKKRRPAPENLAPAKAHAADASVLEEERPRKKRRPADSDASIERPVRTKKAPQKSAEPMDDFSFDYDEEAVQRPRKRKPIDNRKEEPAFSNIPPKHVREAREKEMRQNYQMMVDEDDEDEKGFPTVLIVLLVILLLAAAAFAGYWFFLR